MSRPGEEDHDRAYRAREDREVCRDTLDIEESGHRCVHGGHAEAAAFT